MSPFLIRILPFILIGIFKQITAKFSITESEISKKSNEIIPDIDIRNFDIREKFYECYNPGYDGDYIVIF